MRTVFVTLVAAVLVGTAAPSLSGQSHTGQTKDPAIAVGLAWLCPGCGHLYTGETTKGAVIAAVAFGSVATGFALQTHRFHSEFERASDCMWSGLDSRCGDATMDLTPILVGGAVGIAAWAYGLIDAGASARRVNARSAVGFQALEIQPVVRVDGSLGARLSVPVGW